MTPASFFAEYPQEEIQIRQYAAKSPLFYRDLHMMAAVFAADLETVRSLLPDGRYQPLRVARTRALVAVHCFEYRDSDIGPYNELSLSVGVHFGGKRVASPAAILASIWKEEYHGYVSELPVTTEVALYGGLDFFNFPKYLAEISFAQEAEHRICRLRDRESGELIVAFKGRALTSPGRVDKAKPPRPARMTLASYPQSDGKTLRARFALNLKDAARSWLRGHATLTPGTHPRAQLFRRLALGRPIQYIFAPSCEAILFPPEIIP